MAAATEWAGGTVPVPDGEGVLDLRSWFSIPGEETGKQRVGLLGKGVNSELPAEGPGQLSGPVTDQGAADGTRDLRCDVAGEAVDALEDEEVARGVQV